jgi:hypothetical protein
MVGGPFVPMPTSSPRGAARRARPLRRAFFRNFEQQPLGPGVVNSVTNFLGRIDELKSSKLMRASEVAAAPATDPTARLKAQREQQEAYDDLRDWFNDWATTMRQVLPTRDLVRLGLVTINRAGKAVPDEGEGDVVEEGEAVED